MPSGVSFRCSVSPGFPAGGFRPHAGDKGGIFDHNASKAVALGGNSKTLKSGEVAGQVPNRPAQRNHRAVRLRA